MSIVSEAKFNTEKFALRGGVLTSDGITGLLSSMQADAGSLWLHVVDGSSEFFNAAFQGSVAVLGVGLGAMLEHRIATKERDQEERRITDIYRNEIAAQTGIAPKKVGVVHLKVAAESNSVLKAALNNNDKRVHLKMASWMAAAAAGGIGLFLLAPVIAMAIPAAMTGYGIALFAAKMAAGMALFHVAEKIAHRVGEKTMRLGPTAHDQIKTLYRQRSRGQALSPVQTLGVFARANPAIGTAIKMQTGKTFDQLDQRQLYAVAQQYDESLGLAKITAQINNGERNVTELAWRAQNQESGVPPLDVSQTKTARVKEVVTQAVDHMQKTSHNWVGRLRGGQLPAPAIGDAPGGFVGRFAAPKLAADPLQESMIDAAAPMRIR